MIKESFVQGVFFTITSLFIILIIVFGSIGLIQRNEKIRSCYNDDVCVQNNCHSENNLSIFESDLFKCIELVQRNIYLKGVSND
jgi:hypothetical protein